MTNNSKIHNKKYQTFKALGLLLTYPKDNYFEMLDLVFKVVNSEKLLSKSVAKQVCEHIIHEKKCDLLKLQEEYVETFDRSRFYCLYLFEHIHGDSRDRGQAMVDLAEMYHEKSLFIDSKELPDYIPLFLEFLSNCEVNEALQHLTDAGQIFFAISSKLKKKGNKFYPIFNAISKIPNIKADKSFIAKAIQSMDNRDDSLDALDEEWEEKPAFSKDQNLDCNSCDAIENAHNLVQQMKDTIK